MISLINIAIVLTACGIETNNILILQKKKDIAIVLTACGIETPLIRFEYILYQKIAIVLTACGIETKRFSLYLKKKDCNSTYRLRY